MKLPAKPRRRARIEIIPLIDVVFFLLATFVMVSLSMSKDQGIAVNLPVAATGVSQKVPAMVTISIKQDGHLYLDKDILSDDQLSAQLIRLKAADPDLKVLINADENVPFGSAVKVLDEVKQLGITKVAIRTKPE